jgi:autotransporter-associated beta strand protein
MKAKNPLRSFLFGSSVAAIFTLQSAQAVDFWWDGGTANWTTVAAWSTVSNATTPDPGAVPNSATTADVFFNITTNNSNNTVSLANGSRSARSITFNTEGSSNFRAGGANTAASTLTIGAGGITVNTGAGTVLIGETPSSFGNLTVALSANQVWTNNSDNQLTVTGAVNGTNIQLTKSGTGQIRLNGANGYTGATIVNGGNLTIGNYAGLSNTSGITVSGGTAGLQLAQVGAGTTTNTINKSLSLHGFLRIIGGTADNRLNQTWDGNITLAGASTIQNNGNSLWDINGQINLGAHALTFQTDGTGSRIDGNIIGEGGSLNKTNAQGLTLHGTNTYSGITTISGGTLALGATGSIDNTSSISVATGATFNVSAVTGGYTLGAAQTLTGAGTVTGAMTVAGTLSPGNSPGFMATGSQTWVNGGDYNFQMLDATGIAGTGFDQIQVTGSLDLTNLTAAGFAINLWSLASTGPDTNGNALNFNNSIDQSWIILTTTGGITSFDAANFTVNVGANNGTSGFSNALGGGSFSLGADSNNLILSFTAVPEPSAALLGGIGLLLLVRRRTRCD